MNCPYCNNKEMSEGIIQGGQSILWTHKIHRLSMRPKKDDIEIATDWAFGYGNVRAYRCAECNKFIINGEDTKSQKENNC